MNLKRNLLIASAILLFAGGTFLNLLLSSNLLWGELEARSFTQQTGGRSLDIECPLMIATWETGAIRTVVTNTLPDQSTKPQVNAFISRENDMRVETQTLELDAQESRPLQWSVTSADIVFDRLILVSVLQRPYRELDSRQGTCSIYVFSLFGLTGQKTLIAMLTAGMFLSLLGIGGAYYLLRPLTEFASKLITANGIFLILVLAGLFSALPRLWGFTLVFNSGALLVITVASVEILLSPKK